MGIRDDAREQVGPRELFATKAEHEEEISKRAKALTEFRSTRATPTEQKPTAKSHVQHNSPLVSEYMHARPDEPGFSSELLERGGPMAGAVDASKLINVPMPGDQSGAGYMVSPVGDEQWLTPTVALGIANAHHRWPHGIARDYDVKYHDGAQIQSTTLPGGHAMTFGQTRPDVYVHEGNHLRPDTPTMDSPDGVRDHPAIYAQGLYNQPDQASYDGFVQNVGAKGFDEPFMRQAAKQLGGVAPMEHQMAGARPPLGQGGSYDPQSGAITMGGPFASQDTYTQWRRPQTHMGRMMNRETELQAGVGVPYQPRDWWGSL